MGANILLNLLGSGDSSALCLRGCVSVCGGYDILAACHFIPRHRPLYNRFLSTKLRQVLRAHKHHWEHNNNANTTIDVHAVLATTCVREFDRLFTCKLLDYASPEDYYRDQSCVHRLHAINTPLLMVNALDDPIIPEMHLQQVVNLCKDSDHCVLAVPPHGGHLGFAEGFLLPKQEAWMDRVSLEFLESVVHANS